MARMRIGILGGTFDPPHLGHVQIVRHVRAYLNLDEVLVIPAGEPWQKTDVVATPQQRLAMTRAAFEGEPGVRVSDLEVQRSGPTYTVDTVRTLRAQQPEVEWFLILGQDAAEGMATWREPAAITEMARVAIVTRTSESALPVPEGSCWVPMEPVEISSTQVRHRCAGGEPIDDLVPPPVAAYIHDHHLYVRG